MSFTRLPSTPRAQELALFTYFAAAVGFFTLSFHCRLAEVILWLGVLLVARCWLDPPCHASEAPGN